MSQINLCRLHLYNPLKSIAFSGLNHVWFCIRKVGSYTYFCWNDQKAGSYILDNEPHTIHNLCWPDYFFHFSDKPIWGDGSIILTDSRKTMHTKAIIYYAFNGFVLVKKTCPLWNVWLLNAIFEKKWFVVIYWVNCFVFILLCLSLIQEQPWKLCNWKDMTDMMC